MRSDGVHKALIALDPGVQAAALEGALEAGSIDADAAAALAAELQFPGWQGFQPHKVGAQAYGGNDPRPLGDTKPLPKSNPLFVGASGSACVIPEAEPLLAHEIHFRILGDPRNPPLVFVHGMDTSHATFDPVAEELARDYRVILYDQRGHGQTPAKGLNYQTQTLANDLLALLDQLGVPQVYLLGHSMGARTAVRFAEQYPDRVRSLLIVDMEMTRRHQEPIETIIEKGQQLEQAMSGRFDSTTQAEEQLVPLFGAAKTKTILQHQCKIGDDGAVELSFSPSVSVLYRGTAGGEDLTGAYRSLLPPTQVLRADEGASAISQQGLARMKELRPDVEVIDVPGANHYVHQSRPAELIAAVKRFFV